MNGALNLSLKIDVSMVLTTVSVVSVSSMGGANVDIVRSPVVRSCRECLSRGNVAVTSVILTTMAATVLSGDWSSLPRGVGGS